MSAALTSQSAPDVPVSPPGALSSFWIANCDALLTHLGVLELSAIEQHQRYAVSFVQELRDITTRFRRRAEMEVKA